MSNILTDIGHDLKVGAVDTAHGVEKALGAIPKVIAVLSSALKDEPQVKSAVIALVTEFGTLTADGTLAVASDGTNLVEDASAVTAGEALLTYFKSTFIPVVEALYGDIKADLSLTN